MLHLGTLAFLCAKWIQSARLQTNQSLFFGPKQRLSTDYILYTLLVSNFVGIAFARTLHYQFYSWYFHALPLLLWISPTYPIGVRLLLLGMIEYSFNVFPATPVSSVVLQLAHLVTLIGLTPPQHLKMTILETSDSTDKQE
jgi:alpha-1,3-mannosyltransferase